MTQINKIAAEYEDQGFAIIRNVVDTDLIQEIREHVAWLVAKYPDLRPEHLHHPLIRNDAFWVRLITDSRLVDIAECFIGPNIACFTAHYICKPPYDGQPVLWHQDAAYWSLEPMNALTIWLAVDASNITNGCLRMIPGSHRIPVHVPSLRVDTPNVLFSSSDDWLVDKLAREAGIVNIELEPGDVSIHHPNILHCSEPNTSSARRCGLDIGYIPTSTRITSEGLYLDPILVRGKPGDGINSYRKYPRYVPGETIPFHGNKEWNLQVEAFNRRANFTADPGPTESPIEMVQHMMARLQEGTVKR
jgi:phytanoyl-CoA hydroxylase